MQKGLHRIIFVTAALASVRADIATYTECTSGPSPSLGCTNTDPPTFTVTYPAGEMKCQSALTIEQAALEPTLSLANDDESSGKFYTVLLVDTGDSMIHPILHYGASNIPGEELNEMTLSSVNPFSSYRGPAPPAYVPGIETQLFNYEWIVAEQESFVEEPPLVVTNVQFSYNDYLTAVGGTTLSTSYFSSGFCVKELIPTSAPSESPKGKKAAKSSKKAAKSLKASKMPKKAKKAPKS